MGQSENGLVGAWASRSMAKDAKTQKQVRKLRDAAARLVDQVLPAVPIRQWVLSFPIEIRYRLA